MGKVSVGHDWAEARHDVYVEDREARPLAKARLPEGSKEWPPGITVWR